VKLDGFRCDHCGTESVAADAPHSWIEVRSVQISSTGLNHSSFGISGGLHYCRRACLLASIQTKWERERP
jgi:hypothetical protein